MEQLQILFVLIPVLVVKGAALFVIVYFAARLALRHERV